MSMDFYALPFVGETKKETKKETMVMWQVDGKGLTYDQGRHLGRMFARMAMNFMRENNFPCLLESTIKDMGKKMDPIKEGFLYEIALWAMATENKN